MGSMTSLRPNGGSNLKPLSVTARWFAIFALWLLLIPCLLLTAVLGWPARRALSVAEWARDKIEELKG